ncbi:hypothetical protein EVAR_46840_1 [Eumeta japonica]|uniref:Uncharacterized protein n=1 Tax=Eumeta variegata TaxID=151549 RepID=A0A4C1XMA0_EUMVA|nr:hypothetical protein EVAR_46840_1 [Eumeta japonica]
MRTTRKQKQRSTISRLYMAQYVHDENSINPFESGPRAAGARGGARGAADPSPPFPCPGSQSAPARKSGPTVGSKPSRLPRRAAADGSSCEKKLCWITIGPWAVRRQRTLGRRCYTILWVYR